MSYPLNDESHYLTDNQQLTTNRVKLKALPRQVVVLFPLRSAFSLRKSAFDFFSEAEIFHYLLCQRLAVFFLANMFFDVVADFVGIHFKNRNGNVRHSFLF